MLLIARINPRGAYDQAADFAVVDLPPRKLERLFVLQKLCREGLLSEAREFTNDLCFLDFRDNPGTGPSRLETLAASLRSDASDDVKLAWSNVLRVAKDHAPEWLLVNHPWLDPSDLREHAQAASFDLEEMVVTPCYFYWTFAVKHTDATFETRPVPFQEFDKIAELLASTSQAMQAIADDGAVLAK